MFKLLKQLLALKFQFILLILLSLTVISTIKCKKAKYTPPDVLPAVTQDGKNSFGCKINGEVWVPHYECPAFRDNCSELSAVAGNSLMNGFYRLYINAGRWFGNTNTRLSIATYPGHTISSTGDKSDSVEVYFYGDNNKIYNHQHYPGNVKKFVVTRFDTTNKIVSGIFDFTLYQSRSDSITVTEGRFDVKFLACLCSK